MFFYRSIVFGEILLDLQLRFLWQAIIPRLEMSGKEKEAITILQEALKKAKTDQQTHKAYELEMLLVEMLIYEVPKTLSLSFIASVPNTT